MDNVLLQRQQSSQLVYDGVVWCTVPVSEGVKEPAGTPSGQKCFQ